MKKTSIDKFSDYISNIKYRRSFFTENINLFHPKPLYLITCFIFFCFSLFSLHFLRIALPLAAVYIYTKLILKKYKKNAKTKTMFPTKGKEESSICIKHTTTNPSGFKLFNFLLIDFFEGHRNSANNTQHVRYYPTLEPHQKLTDQRMVVLNNGMGKKRFGPSVSQITDPLGLHRLTVHSTFSQEIEVYPMVFPSKVPKTKPSFEQLNYGNHDTQNRGDNINFFCAREYRQGDNIKHINWKLSLKSNKTIINQFENNTNSNINLFLIDDSRLHYGSGAIDSFEYCKDLLLSFCHSHINSNNSIGLFSHQLKIKPKAGKNHLTALELAMTRLHPKDFNQNNMYSKKKRILPEIQLILDHVVFHTEEAGELYIFSGFIPGRVWDMYFEIFTQLAKRNFAVHLVIPYGFNSILNHVSDLDKDWINRLIKDLPNQIKDLKDSCQKSGLKLSLTSIDSNDKYSKKIRNGFQLVQI